MTMGRKKLASVGHFHSDGLLAIDQYICDLGDGDHATTAPLDHWAIAAAMVAAPPTG